MQGRTRLTTPPGEEPADPISGKATQELYSGGFDRPSEPHVPGRHRRKLITLVALVILGAVGYVGYVVTTQGQFQDPALSDLLPGQTETTGEGEPSPGQG
ncbi:MAG: hypothetical protein R3343_09385 [Nitriliruptorales bacterium]|nr:hypothetical protein [Nitriliruptorales bacterium]